MAGVDEDSANGAAPEASTSVPIASRMWGGRCGQAITIRSTLVGRSTAPGPDAVASFRVKECPAASGARCPDAAGPLGPSGNSLSFNELESGGGGNRTCTACRSKECERNDFGELPEAAAALWLHGNGMSRQSPSSNCNDDSSSSSEVPGYLLCAWPHLPPHIREAILTLIDSAYPSSVQFAGVTKSSRMRYAADDPDSTRTSRR
jgi:hypothetical protein